MKLLFILLDDIKVERSGLNKVNLNMNEENMNNNDKYYIFTSNNNNIISKNS